jgi:hypothetical protein
MPCGGIAFEPKKVAVAGRTVNIGCESILISSDAQTIARRVFNLHEPTDKVIIATATMASVLTGRPNFDMPGKFQDRMDGKPHREE